MESSWLKGMLARARLLFAAGAAESRMDEEMRFHLEMEAERLVREEGLDPAEARRRARVAFGGEEKYREEMREGRGLAWLSGLRLDLKLGARMLIKYPILTGASVLALAIAVALAASWFEFMTDLAYPRLPLPEGERIVQLANMNEATADEDANNSEPRSLHDFEIWRDELRTVEDLSAVSPVEYGVTTPDGRLTTLEGTRVTASFFTLARVAPLLGRGLTESDQDPAAPQVAVLGYEAWQRLFDGDRAAIGQTLRLGADYATVVGVMPEGFGFPVNEEIWTPLRESAVNYARRQGPQIMMLGRLAPGVELERAKAELATVGERTAAAFPDTHEHLRPQVKRFARGGWQSRIALTMNVPFLLFLIVVSANVATLLFARTATRESEIALRSALGASRGRILAQLVAESLVLTSIAAALGLAAASFGMPRIMDLFWEVQQATPPFWFDFGLSAATSTYVAALAVIGAIIIGGIPGLRATRRGLRSRIGQPGASGMKFGAVATGVIVVQVALCVAFLPYAITNAWGIVSAGEESDFPAETYLAGEITRQGAAMLVGPGAAADGEPERQRTAQLFDEVHRRLKAEPAVLAATRADRMPGFNHPVETFAIELDSTFVVEARQIAVDADFFDVVGARIVAGRGFRPEDATAAVDVAVVDEEWAAEIYGERSALGRRIRYPASEEAENSRWYEIVGVVEGMEAAIGPGSSVRIFRPLRPAEHASVQIYARTSTPPEILAPQVHALITSVDPTLSVTNLMPLAVVWSPVERSGSFFVAGLAVVSMVILLFALIGIYALMSFTVAQREREIGIRAALGASPRRIVVSIFSRAMMQIGLGVVLGAVLISLALADDPEGIRLVAAVAASMMLVGLIGCATPAVRALRIQPVEALRAE